MLICFGPIVLYLLTDLSRKFTRNLLVQGMKGKVNPRIFAYPCCKGKWIPDTIWPLLSTFKQKRTKTYMSCQI